LGRDPKQEGGGLNLYGFVLNNPINAWDYLGMEPGYDPMSGGITEYVEEEIGDGYIRITTYESVDNIGADDGSYTWKYTGETIVMPRFTVKDELLAPNSAGPSALAVGADALGGSGLPVIPKPSALGSGGFTSPASHMARAGLPNIELSQPLPAPTYGNANIMSTNLRTVAGRVVPVAGIPIAAVDTVTSSNPLRTSMGHIFGFGGAAIGGAAGVIVALPTGGLAVPITGATGLVGGGYMGNQLGTGIYDWIAGMGRSPTPQPVGPRPGG
jgi:hypothetical protein